MNQPIGVTKPSHKGGKKAGTKHKKTTSLQPQQNLPQVDHTQSAGFSQHSMFPTHGVSNQHSAVNSQRTAMSNQPFPMSNRPFPMNNQHFFMNQHSFVNNQHLAMDNTYPPMYNHSAMNSIPFQPPFDPSINMQHGMNYPSPTGNIHSRMQQTMSPFQQTGMGNAIMNHMKPEELMSMTNATIGQQFGTSGQEMAYLMNSSSPPSFPKDIFGIGVSDDTIDPLNRPSATLSRERQKNMEILWERLARQNVKLPVRSPVNTSFPVYQQPPNMGFQAAQFAAGYQFNQHPMMDRSIPQMNTDYCISSSSSNTDPQMHPSYQYRNRGVSEQSIFNTSDLSTRISNMQIPVSDEQMLNKMFDCYEANQLPNEFDMNTNLFGVLSGEPQSLQLLNQGDETTPQSVDAQQPPEDDVHFDHVLVDISGDEDVEHSDQHQSQAGCNATSDNLSNRNSSASTSPSVRRSIKLRKWMAPPDAGLRALTGIPSINKSNHKHTAGSKHSNNNSSNHPAQDRKGKGKKAKTPKVVPESQLPTLPNKIAPEDTQPVNQAGQELDADDAYIYALLREELDRKYPSEPVVESIDEQPDSFFSQYLLPENPIVFNELIMEEN